MNLKRIQKEIKEKGFYEREISRKVIEELDSKTAESCREVFKEVDDWYTKSHFLYSRLRTANKFI